MKRNVWLALEITIILIGCILILFRRVASVDFKITYDSYPAILLAFGLGMLIRDLGNE